jgi:hypothetical protein
MPVAILRQTGTVWTADQSFCTTRRFLIIVQSCVKFAQVSWDNI